MIRAVVLTSAALLGAVVPRAAAAQRTMVVSGAESALLRRMQSPTSWLGVLVGDADGGVVVGLVMPTRPADVGLETADRVERLNGTPVSDVRQLTRLYDAVSTGAPIVLTVRRHDRVTSLRFAKPDPAAVPTKTAVTQRVERSVPASGTVAPR